MIRTFVIPTQSNYKVTLDFPEDYVGEEIEIIAFKKHEGLKEESLSKPYNMERFRGILTFEEADQLQEYVKTSRKEWDKNI